MARGTERGRNQRPTRFADGSNAWEPATPQENAPPSSGDDVPQQEHPTEPAEVTPGEETPGESEIQLGEQITTAQLMQVLVQQQVAAREDMRRILEVQQGQQQQIIQQIFQERQSQQQQGAGNQYERQINLLDFKKYAPPAFSGTSDPMEAESWLKAIEKVFHALRYLAEDKVTFATFMLQGEAADWWEMKIGKLGPNDVPFTWEEFRKIFYDKYFPQTKFEELSRYAPTLIAEENVRARKFENGLRDRIQQLVTVFELPSYKEVVNKCLIIEKGLNDAHVAREKSMKKRGRAIDSQGQSSRAFKPKTPKLSQTATE
uniref:Uncharacterized protein LOC105037278 n=1 Tax=Elaeis guineensis var. tenera TaxID=51953 RepID=A0A6I9QN49_ELAGV